MQDRNMRYLRNMLLMMLLMASQAPWAQAQEAACPSCPPAVSSPRPERAQLAGYLSRIQKEINDFLPPPAAGSSEDKADLDAVRRWQKDRTPAQCAAAKAQTDDSFTALFGSVNPFPKPLPAAVSAFFKRVSADASDANRYIKNIYKRPRPFLRDQNLDPCIGRSQGYSYPSGHSTAARLFGNILADIDPARRTAYMIAADQAAMNRVIGGVHHPSDIEAGKKLGDLLYGELRANNAFNADMAALSQYIKRQAP